MFSFIFVFPFLSSTNVRLSVVIMKKKLRIKNVKILVLQFLVLAYILKKVLNIFKILLVLQKRI